ncbi:MAG: nitrite reductase, copper-containing, partial [Methylobacter sp.]
MNKTQSLLLLSIALSNSIVGCSDEAKYKAMEKKYQAIQAEKAKHQTMSAEEMAVHSDAKMHHAMTADSTGTHKIDTAEIGRNADDLSPPLNRTQAQLVRVDLYTDELVAEMMP